MIYIFKGFASIGSLPATCCQACGKACKQCPGGCQAVTAPFRKCCTGCAGQTRRFFEMPLGFYVFCSIASAGFFAYSANEDMTDEAKECTESRFLIVLIGFAALYAVFSVYMFFQVQNTITGKKDPNSDKYKFPDDEKKYAQWSNKYFEDVIDEFSAQQLQAAQDKKQGNAKTMAKAKEGLSALTNAVGVGKKDEEAQPLNEEDQMHGEGDDPQMRYVPSEVVQEAFSKVFWEDLGVLGMFVLMIAMVVVARSPSLIPGVEAEDKCKPGSNTKMGPTVYFALSALFTFVYRCCKCCSGTVSLAPLPKEEDE